MIPKIYRIQKSTHMAPYEQAMSLKMGFVEKILEICQFFGMGFKTTNTLKNCHISVYFDAKNA